MQKQQVITEISVKYDIPKTCPKTSLEEKIIVMADLQNRPIFAKYMFQYITY